MVEDMEDLPVTNSFLEGTGQITIEDLKQALPSQDYDTLTIGDDKNGIHCLLVAKLRCKADILSTGNSYDESISECRLALMKLWLYEMFSFVGESDKAKDAYEDYTLIIKTSFGSIHTKGEESRTEETGPAVGVVLKPKDRSLYGRYHR